MNNLSIKCTRKMELIPTPSPTLWLHNKSCYVLYLVKTHDRMMCIYSHSEAHSEPCQTSKIELRARIINGWKHVTVFVKSLTLGVWQCSEYTSTILLLKPENNAKYLFRDALKHERMEKLNCGRNKSELRYTRLVLALNANSKPSCPSWLIQRFLVKCKYHTW